MRARLSSRTWSRPALLAAALIGGVVGACTITNQNHCAYPGSDTKCGSGLVCDRCAAANDGCVAPEALTAESCLLGDSATTTETSTSETTTTTTTTTTVSTTEPTTVDPTTMDTTTTTTTTMSTSMSTTVNDPDLPPGFTCDPKSPANAECFNLNPDMPYCVADHDCGDCSALTVKSCADIDPNTPACPESGGICVECTADNLKACGPNQICNQYLSDCGACFEHEQCGSGACNQALGTCFPDTNELWVDNSGTCVNPSGTEANPYCEIADAIADNVGKNLLIKVKPGSGSYKAPFLVDNGVSIVVQGAVNDGEKLPVVSDPLSTVPLVTVNGNSTLLVDRLAIDGSTAVMTSTIKCTGSTLWITRGSVSKNNNPINGDTCNITLERVVYTGNTGGSNITKGSFRIANSFVTSNNSGANGSPFRVNASLDIAYSTIVNNMGLAATGVYCLSNDPATVRNSVLLGAPAVVSGCTYVDMEADREGTYEGMPNQLNVLFQAPSGGVYRPKPAADAISGLAVWRPGDPFIDYFAELRPNVEGAADFSGASYP